MIYVIDHNDSFTHNVVHQFAIFDKVECDNYDRIDENKIKASFNNSFFTWTRKSKKLPNHI